MSNNYKINISDVNFMVKNTIQKIRKIKIQYIISCQFEFISIFEKKITKYEGIEVLLTKDSYVINKCAKRINTAFLRIKSRCKYSNVAEIQTK